MRIIDILSRKRNRKFIFIILIIIGVIFILHNKGYCAQDDTTYTTDTSYFMLEQYDSLCDLFTLSFNKFYGSDPTATSRFNSLFESVQGGNFPYFYMINSTSGTSDSLRILFYNRSTARTYVDTSLVYNDGTRIPTTAYNFTQLAGNTFYLINMYETGTAHNQQYLWLYSASLSNDFNFTLPFIMLYKIPKQFIDCMERAGYTYTNNQDIIDIKTQLNQLKNKIDTTNDKLTGVQDTLDSFTDTNQDTSDITNVDTSASTSITSGEDYQQVESSYNGVWSNFISTINSMNESTPETIVIPLPYVNKQMLVSSNIISSRISSSIKSIITMFWWFVFGRHIILLWKRIFEYFASGSILNEESNSSGVLGFRNILKNYVDTINPFMM